MKMFDKIIRICKYPFIKFGAMAYTVAPHIGMAFLFRLLTYPSIFYSCVLLIGANMLGHTEAAPLMNFIVAAMPLVIATLVPFAIINNVTIQALITTAGGSLIIQKMSVYDFNSTKPQPLFAEESQDFAEGEKATKLFLEDPQKTFICIYTNMSELKEQLQEKFIVQCEKVYNTLPNIPQI